MSNNENPWVRTARATAYENDWIRVSHDTVVRPDGKPGIYGVVHFKKRATGVVAVDAADRMLLVGQYRYTLDQYSWEIPEGGADEGEAPIEAARRELKEETGYEAGKIECILRAHLSNSVSDEEAYCFLASELTCGQASPEGTEKLEVRWAPFAEVLEMIATGAITDALTILAVQQVAILRMRT